MKRKRYPKLPVPEGKARQMLSTALMLHDDATAAWIDRAIKAGHAQRSGGLKPSRTSSGGWTKSCNPTSRRDHRPPSAGTALRRR